MHLNGGTGYGQPMQTLRRLRRDAGDHVWDFVVAGAMVAVALVALITRLEVRDTDAYRFHGDTWWSWAATIAVCAALVGRRRWPLRTLAVGLVLTVPLELGRHPDTAAFFASVIALFSVATYLPLRLAWRAVPMIAVLYAILIASGTTIVTTAPLLGPLFLATGFMLGRTLRRNRARQEREVEAAIARAAEAVESTELQAAGERLRLAQELHDVVAHSLSVIAVQAGIGVHLLDRQPAEAARALDAIRTTSRTTKDELSRLVNILRDGEGTDDGAPSLTDISKLIEQIGTAGVPIALTTEGDLATVPAGVSLAAYRIVQEALTNVVRHAGRARATVTVQAGLEHVELTIDDDGHGATSSSDPSSTGGGHGLIGMSERAAMYGGEIRSGPRPGGGFRVRATLPYSAGPIVKDAPTEPTLASPSADGAAPNRWRPSPWMWDLMLAAFLAVLTTVQLTADNPAGDGPHYTPTNLAAWLLRIGCCLPVIVRRRFPTAAYAVSWLLGLVLVVGDYQVGATTFVLWIGLYSVASYATRRRLVWSLIGTYAGTAIIAWSKPPDLNNAGAVLLGIFFTASAVAGYVVRSDRERRTTHLVEREDAAEAQSQRALLVITTERLRIADELNTIMQRSIHTIAQEAKAGSPIVDTDPVAARKSLEAISAISRDALSDLRRLLKHMRTETEAAPYAPIGSGLGKVSAGESR